MPDTAINGGIGLSFFDMLSVWSIVQTDNENVSVLSWFRFKMDVRKILTP